jgi:hypothetical protein
MIFQELYPALRYIPEEKSGDAATIRARNLFLEENHDIFQRIHIFKIH